jgi:hypothetical protein
LDNTAGILGSSLAILPRMIRIILYGSNITYSTGS